MRRSLLLFALLVACDREEGQRHACTRFAEHNVASPDPMRWIEQCVKERWTQRQMECYARAPAGSFLGMFCE
jgi:hypothetical protein